MLLYAPTASHYPLSDALCLTSPRPTLPCLPGRVKVAKGANGPKTQTIGSHPVVLTLGRHILSDFGPTPSGSRSTGCERERNER